MTVQQATHEQMEQLSSFKLLAWGDGLVAFPYQGHMPSVPKHVFRLVDIQLADQQWLIIHANNRVHNQRTNQPTSTTNQATNQPTSQLSSDNLFCSRPTCYMDLPGIYTNQIHSNPKLLQVDQFVVSVRCFWRNAQLILVAMFGAHVWWSSRCESLAAQGHQWLGALS